MDAHVVISQVYRNVGVVHVVIAEVLLDHVALVAEANHKFSDAMGSVNFHYVPQDRLTADLDERLRPNLGLFRYAGSSATRQNDTLHA